MHWWINGFAAAHPFRAGAYVLTLDEAGVGASGSLAGVITKTWKGAVKTPITALAPGVMYDEDTTVTLTAVRK